MKNFVDQLLTTLPQDFYSDYYNHLSKIIYKVEKPQQKWIGATVVLIVDDHFVFIRRSMQLRNHPGQIAFLGGHKEFSESCPWSVARREFYEETSVDQSLLRFIGFSPPVYVANDRLIIPVVASASMKIKAFLEIAKSNGEWSDIFAIPVRELQKEETWNYAHRYGQTCGYLLYRPLLQSELVFASSDVSYQKDVLLWGATARMVWNLLRIHFNGKTLADIK